FLAQELSPGTKRPTGRFFAYREYHPARKLPPATHAVDLLKGEPATPLFVGGARSEDEWRDKFRQAGLPVLEPPISGVEPQIDSVYEMIADDRLLVADDCEGLLDELASYSYVVDERGEPTEQIEDDHSFHRCAALRYLCSYLVRMTGGP